jgi:hypothetical protein
MSEDALTTFARKRFIVATLRDLNDCLHSAEMLIRIEQLPDEDQATFGKLMFAVSLSYQKMKTAALDPIRNAIDEDASEIDAAADSLNTRLHDFEKIKPILDGATAFLKVIGRIVALV